MATIKSISEFKPRTKYIIYGEFSNVIGTYRYFKTILTINEINALLNSNKISEFI